MEVQFTDFENAAFTVFVVLLSRVILFFNLNFYMPLSLVDENFRRASLAGAAVSQLFWFPRQFTPCSRGGGESSAPSSSGSGGGGGGSPPAAPSPPHEMSLLHIMHGDGSDEFPGILSCVLLYLDILECDPASRSTIETYLQFIGNRARGAAMTGAAWQRDFVARHPSYRQDSVISPGIATDLLRAVAEVGKTIQGLPFSPLLTPLVGPLEALGPAGGGARVASSASSSTSSTSSTSTSRPSVGDPLSPNRGGGGGGGGQQIVSPRLRGSSFFKDVSSRRSQCSVLKSLFASFKEKS
jgi:hypothetical protein